MSVEGAAGRVLVAGIGNIFLSDDGFGVEVVSRLAARPEPLPVSVTVSDFGIRGLHLAYELLEGYDVAVLVDAMPLGEAPGTLALLELEGGGATDAVPAVDAHAMTPDAVLANLARLGGSVQRVLVVGCQPESLDEGIGLSGPVADAVDGAMAMIDDLLVDLARAVHRTERREPVP